MQKLFILNQQMDKTFDILSAQTFEEAEKLRCKRNKKLVHFCFFLLTGMERQLSQLPIKVFWNSRLWLGGCYWMSEILAVVDSVQRGVDGWGGMDLFPKSWLIMIRQTPVRIKPGKNLLDALPAAVGLRASHNPSIPLLP